MISHRALLATTTGPTIQWFSQKMKIETSDKYMSFLSPAHVYEQNMEVLTHTLLGMSFISIIDARHLLWC